MMSSEKKSTNKEKFKLLLPYYLLALAIIITFVIIFEIRFFLNFIGQAWDVFTPFFYGFLIAYIVNMPCSAIQKVLVRTNIKFIVKRQRMFSVLAVILIFGLIIYLTLDLIIPAIADSISFFIINVPMYWEGIVEFIEYFNSWDIFGWYISPESVFGFLADRFADFNVGSLITPLNAIFGVGASIFTGVIAFISSIYIMIEKDRFKGFLVRMLNVYTSAGVSKAIIGYADRLNKNFRQYVRVQTIDGIILGTLATIQLAVAGSPYALMLGIMLGIVNYVPYFGSIFGTMVAVIVVAFTQGVAMGLIMAVTLFITQQVDANIVQPRLMSGSYALSPLLVIISITVGGAIAGILGMIAAIPIVAVLKEMYESITAYYEDKKFEESNKNNGNEGASL